MPNNVYIFRGGPASGKGTITKEFCKLLGQPTALIQQDNLRWNFHLVGREIPDVTDKEHRFANSNTLMLFEEYLKNGSYNIVVEGLFTWNDKQSSQGTAIDYKNTAEKHGYKPILILLKADKTVLQQRNQARDYSVPDQEFDQLHSNVYGLVGDDEIVIDSTEMTIQQTLMQLERLVRS